MSTVNLIFENLNALYSPLTALAASVDPVCVLYSLLAGTYGSAACAAAANDHRSLCRCYIVSAILHGLIGVMHSFGG